MTAAALVLPSYGWGDKQQDPPGSACTIATHAAGRLVFTIQESGRRCKRWHASASQYEREGDHKLPIYAHDGRCAWRASNTIATSSKAKADAWIAAVAAGNVSIGDRTVSSKTAGQTPLNTRKATS